MCNQYAKCARDHRRRPLAERFWEKVVKSDGCWLWTGAKTDFGYGLIGRGSANEGNIRAHRLSWELHFGPIPPDRYVLHRCDNPPCVRPDHLFLGTLLDNQLDMARKARVGNQFGKRWGPRRVYGRREVTVKLTAEQVRAIRAEYTGTRGHLRQLARKYGMGQSQIGRIIRRETWRDVA